MSWYHRRSLGSSVAIATGYGLDGAGFDSLGVKCPWRAILCQDEEWWSCNSIPHMSSWNSPYLIEHRYNFTFYYHRRCNW
jgi:hypothetical protein